MPDTPARRARLYRAAAARRLDRLAVDTAGIPGRELMERAGRAAWLALLLRWPRARRLLVICGVGNNGGDGYVLARLAREAGRDVRVRALGPVSESALEATAAAADWRASGGEILPLAPHDCDAVDAIVDAVFGIGLARPVDGVAADAIDAMNASRRPILALDIPSGLHADTGAVLGRAVRAAVTVTFIGMKCGLVTGQGPAHCGELLLDTLDLPPSVLDAVPPDARATCRREMALALPPRTRSGHKGHYGHVLVIGGDVGLPGAPRLAAEAAARSGAGLVTLATHPAHAGALAGSRSEVMVTPVDSADALSPLLQRCTLVAVGPGLGRGPWGRALLGGVLETKLPLVVDADALNLLAGEPGQRSDWILTPHPGEAARLLGVSTAAVEADRYAAVRAIVERYGGVCVLKGAGTLIDDGDLTYVCCAGNPGMASGGMGDVLTGVVAGVLAQGLSPALAARTAVHAHAAAADAAARAGERGLLAGDVIAAVRAQLN